MREIVASMGLALCAALAWASGEQVLLVWNSQNADSQAVRNAFIAAHPAAQEFDLDDPALSPGNVTYEEFIAQLRDPVRAFLRSGFVSPDPGSTDELVTGPTIIATTRGLPARISGANEFAGNLSSTFASIESELALVLYDLRAMDSVPDLDIGPIANPYFAAALAPGELTRVLMPAADAILDVGGPGDKEFVSLPAGRGHAIYAVARIDAPAASGTSSIDATLDVIARSANGPIPLQRSATRSVIDSWTARQVGDPPLLDGGDFEDAALRLADQDIPVLFDQSDNFVTSDEVPGSEPFFVVAGYGENHDVDAGAEDPPGGGTYLRSFDPIHPAGVFIAYESFNGNSLINGSLRGGQQQAGEWLAMGGAVTIAHVAEPFANTVASLDQLLAGLFDGRPAAEAALLATPFLSWQNTALASPLTTIALSATPDRNEDGVINAEDLYIQMSNPADVNASGTIDETDTEIVEDLVRTDETADITTR